MPLEGLQLGHYRLLHPIGGGGMGEVYLAEDIRINRQVAIKVMRTEAAPYQDANATQEAARLFQREMRAISTLDHPHILPLIDFGEEHVNRTTLTYMVMPHRPEGSLADWLQQHASADMLSPQDVAYFIAQAADALQHVHDHQLIHRDIKPSNFLIRNRAGDPGHPDLLLADFGIAKVATAATTTSQSIRGTPAYMAPEQWDGHPEPATDQYALAVMAYQLLTGRLPFQGGPGQVMRQHFTVQPQPPSTFNPPISPTLDAVILRALEKQPTDRFLSITVFAQTFQAAAQDMQAPSVTLIRNAPGSTIMRNSPSGADIRATLAISRRETFVGATRVLTLPGGRHVSVFVPEGIQNGQVIRLEGEGEPSSSGGKPGALILTIAIQQAEAPHPASNAESAEQTIPASNPHLQAWHVKTTDPTVPAPHPELPSRRSLYETYEAYEVAPRRPGLSTSMTILVVGVVVLVILASIGLFAMLRSKQIANNAATITVTTQASQANTPATTQPNATATFIAQNPNPYPPQTATLVLSDPLSDNSRGYHWGEGTDSTGRCQFTGGAYHVSASQGIEICTAHNPDASDFVFEIQMTIIQGSCGGIVFRADLIQGHSYFLRVCTNGSYKLTLVVNPQASNDVIPSRFSPAINTGLNQTNVIAIVARGSTFTLYTNKQQVDTITDGTYTNGLIGVAAIEKHTPTEVAYSNARVWML